jgi:copper homeostasis protein (lipoprotein)
MRGKLTRYFILTAIVALCSCHNNKNNKTNNKKEAKHIVFKGVYSFGPETKTFKDCDNGQEFWVTDSSAQLELQYSQLGFEKPYEPVYIEVEGIKMHSGQDGLSAKYDSTLVVKKLVKIVKDIPPGTCD